MSGVDGPDFPWFRQPRQWLWLATSILLVSLSVLVFLQWRSARSLSAERQVLTIKLNTSRQRQLGLSKDLGAYEDQVQEATDKKQQLIGEIADYSKQIELLTAKTQRLERVHSELEDLDAAFAKFRAAQARFEEKGRKLDGLLKRVAD